MIVRRYSSYDDARRDARVLARRYQTNVVVEGAGGEYYVTLDDSIEALESNREMEERRWEVALTLDDIGLDGNRVQIPVPPPPTADVDDFEDDF